MALLQNHMEWSHEVWHMCSVLLKAAPNTIILGYPWLEKHNLHINWAGERIEIWSLFCLANFWRSAVPQANVDGSISAVSAPDLSSIPKEYHDLQMAYSKDKTLSLPHHQLYDCAIHLLRGAPVPTSHLYSLSARVRMYPRGGGRFLLHGQNRSLRSFTSRWRYIYIYMKIRKGANNFSQHYIYWWSTAEKRRSGWQQEKKGKHVV